MSTLALQVFSSTGHNQSPTIPWGSPTTAGNTLFLAVVVNGGTTINVHPADATWVLQGSEVDGAGSPGVSVSLYMIQNAPSRSGTETMNIVLASDDTTPSSQFYSLFLLEYPGLITSSVVDQSDSASSTLGSTIDTGATPTTGSSNDIAVVVCGHNNAPPDSDFDTNSTGYTLLAKLGSSSTGATRVQGGVYEKQLGASGGQFQFTVGIIDSTGAPISHAWAVKALALKTQNLTPVAPAVPPAQGLFRAGATTIQSTYMSSMAGWTYYAQWNQLQQANGASLNGSDVAGIDNAIAAATAAGKQLKVRLFCGETTPTWLINAVGTFLHHNSQDPSTDIRTYPKFWTAAYLNAYDALIQQMAARWDSSTILVDVTISNTMLRFAEPLIRDVGDPQNRAELVGGGTGWSGTFIATPGAGYTEAKNKAAIQAGITSHATYFTQTCSSFAFNPYQSITSYSTFDANDDATISQTKALIDYFKLVLGDLGVLENNSVRDAFFTYDATGKATGLSTTNTAYQLMYAYMAAYGPPSFYQTATRSPTNRIGDFNKTMSGIDIVLGGNAVEPPTTYFTEQTAGNSDSSEYTPANFAAWNAALVANPAGGGNGSATQKAGVDSLTLTETATLTRSRSGSTTYTGSYGPQWGGAYCNTLAIDPRDPGGAAVFGDFWGIHATDNQGFNWSPRMRKLGTTGHTGGNQGIYGRSVVAASVKYPGRYYHLSGGLHGSYGGGWFGWTEGIAAAIHISASSNHRGGATVQAGTSTWGSSSPAGQRPRAAGQWIAVDYDPSTGTEYIYALMTTDTPNAVMCRSTDGGETWTDLWVGTVGTTSAADVPEGAWSCIELLDTNADGIMDSVIFSTYRDTSKDGSGPTGSRTWKITGGAASIRAATGTGQVTATNLTGTGGIPAVVEDFTSLPGTGANAGIPGAGGLIAACGPFGVYTSSTGGTTWTKQSGTFFNSSWVSTVDATATNHAVAACVNTGGLSAGANAVATYNGTAWTWKTTGSFTHDLSGTISSVAWGDDVHEWWLMATGAPSFNNALGGSTCDIQLIAIDRNNTQFIMWVGAAGGWLSEDFGGHWRPMPRGLNGGITQNIKADTGADGTVYGSNLDYGFVKSTDNFQTGVRSTGDPNPGSYKTGNEASTLTDGSGNTYTLTLGTTTTDSDLKKNGVSIADDYLRAALIAVQCWDVTPGGVIVIGQYEAPDIRVAKGIVIVGGSQDKAGADSLAFSDNATVTTQVGAPPPPPGGTGTKKHWSKRS